MSYNLYSKTDNGIEKIDNAKTYKEIKAKAKNCEGLALITKVFNNGWETGYKIYKASKPFAYLERYSLAYFKGER